MATHSNTRFYVKKVPKNIDPYESLREKGEKVGEKGEKDESVFVLVFVLT